MTYPASLSAGNVIIAIAFGLAGSWSPSYVDAWDGNYIDPPSGWTEALAPTSGGRAEFDRFESQDLVVGVWYREVPAGGLSGTQVFTIDLDSPGIQNRVYWEMVQVRGARQVNGSLDIIASKDLADTGAKWVADPPASAVTPVTWGETTTDAPRLELITCVEELILETTCADAFDAITGYTELFSTVANPSGIVDAFWSGYRNVPAGYVASAAGRTWANPGAGCSMYGTYPIGGWIALRVLI